MSVPLTVGKLMDFFSAGQVSWTILVYRAS
jgi:hypothetical protein